MPQFKPGQSGNPAGRPKGSRNRRTLVAEALLEGEAEALVRRAVDMGLDGDLAAIRLVLDRLEPARRDGPIDFDLPPITKFQDTVTAYASITEGVTRGELTPLEAEALSRLVDRQVVALEKSEIKDLIASARQAAQKTHDETVPSCDTQEGSL